MDSKHWARSWTVWFNVASFIVAAGDAVIHLLPEGGQKYLLAAVAVANVFLRFRTSQPIVTPKPIEVPVDPPVIPEPQQEVVEEKPAAKPAIKKPRKTKKKQ